MSWTADNMIELATGYWGSAALSAAVDLGLFEALDGAEASAEALAVRLGASPPHTEMLLDALAGLGILEKTGDRYRIETSAAKFLQPSSPQCLLDALRFNMDLYPLWGQLAVSVREGRAVAPAESRLGADPVRTRRFLLGMQSRASAVAPKLLPALNLEDCASLLDLGAGAGTFSCLLLERNARLRATLFDLPSILEITRDLVACHPAASRIAFHPGDYRRDPLPANFDAVLFSGALHQESPHAAAHVMDSIFQSLRRGGEAFIVDMMVGTDRTQPVFSALFAINMMLTHPAARVYSESEVRHLLLEAGFVQPTRLLLDDCPYWVIRASKPN